MLSKNTHQAQQGKNNTRRLNISCKLCCKKLKATGKQSTTNISLIFYLPFNNTIILETLKIKYDSFHRQFIHILPR
jgi:hypothetical protein